ncbi:MAG: hypothetical protein KDC85_01925 [Saprospiraceae bacterium]|nr:hypothetical protein [Saprospiraceae bacterium]MCB9325709.1 hypothetical protein [Lewinellaceae bacterium]
MTALNSRYYNHLIALSQRKGIRKIELSRPPVRDTASLNLNTWNHLNYFEQPDLQYGIIVPSIVDHVTKVTGVQL